MNNIHRLLITGGAGALGRVLREAWRGRYPVIRLSDIAPMAPAQDGQEVVVCDLGDAAAVAAICRNVDAIVHLGGQAVEADWQTINNANITGLINLYEGARLAGIKRVLFASSNHAIGLHRRSSRLDHHSPARPDSRYGLSKAFGEDMAQLYAYKHGIAGFCMRIGSCFPEPRDARMLSSWLSFADFTRLAAVGLSADYVYEIVYGVSRNPRSWWDNSNAYRLGYDPQDNAETFADKVGHIASGDPVTEAFQGGGFVPPDMTGKPELIP
jgi:uronate dehydrogenase